MTKTSLPQGAELTDAGTRFSVWAPERKVVVEITPEDGGAPRTISLERDAAGHHRGVDPAGRAGDRYTYQLDGRGKFPDPASRWQPESVHGPSMVIDPRSFAWHDAEWRRPPFRDLVIYEIHVGTFTPDGTFRSTIEKLPFLAELGVNAIEIMPIADFPGDRGWGYDGVLLFAPARMYGTPDDLRALIAAAHAAGIAVILDVVFNHFGPDGNYIREFSPDYFESKHHTPWGEAINFGSANNHEVRAFFIANLEYWNDEFHFDGFRLDATHTICDDSPRHILEEMADVAHARGCYIIAEDERNEGRLVAPKKEMGYEFDAVWADDFHHTVDAALIDASMYHVDFQGELRELVDALQHGWIFRGQMSRRFGRVWGTRCGHFPPERFVFCLSNHDQAGNRAFGERLNHFISPETYRAASALLCLIPYTPLIFMGQEWGSTSPFLYFTDHNEDLGKLIDEGRRRDMLRFPIFKRVLAEEELPGPQARETFEISKLRWDEPKRAGYAACLRLYREALRLRREHAAFRPKDRAGTHVAELGCGVLAIRAQDENEDWLLLCDLRGGHECEVRSEAFAELPAGQKWHQRFSSNDVKYGGSEAQSYDSESGKLAFGKPEVLVFQAAS